MKTSFFVLCILAAMAATAQTTVPTQLNVFKNGTYFIMREGNASISNYEASVMVPPAPLLSTYWLSTTKDVKIEQIRFINDTLKHKRNFYSNNELLKANIGKKLKLVYMYDEKNVREISGTLLDFNSMASTIKIKSADNRTTFVPYAYVKEISFDENPIEKAEVDSVVRRGFVTFSKQSGTVPVRVSYMQSGIQWTPCYNIKILNDKEVQLELKATVENNMEDDIKNTDLVLTVGSPNFFYGTQLDPIATSYLTYGWGAVGGAAYDQFSNARFDNYQVQTNDMAMSESTAVDYNNYYSYNTGGEKSNDLYFYKCGKVSLPKSSKTSVMIFSQNTTYKDIYEVTIGDLVNYQGNRYVMDTEKNRQTVFHSLRLTNATTQPFTTGPVFVLDENLMPLAQDQLKYTPVKGETSVQLARSSDIVVTYTEEEQSRTDNYTTINRTRYAKVIIKGEIKIENLQEKAINLKVDKTIYAAVTESSDAGVSKKTGSYYGVNPLSEIKWDLNIKGGEKKVLTYTYEVLVP